MMEELRRGTPQYIEEYKEKDQGVITRVRRLRKEMLQVVSTGKGEELTRPKILKEKKKDIT